MILDKNHYLVKNDGRHITIGSQDILRLADYFHRNHQLNYAILSTLDHFQDKEQERYFIDNMSRIITGHLIHKGLEETESLLRAVNDSSHTYYVAYCFNFTLSGCHYTVNRNGLIASNSFDYTGVNEAMNKAVEELQLI